MRTSTRFPFFALLFFLLTAIASCAQVLDGTTIGQNERPEQRSYNAEDEQGLKFKAQSVLVQVPVVVVDKAGNHVHNLIQDEFKVLENGKAQKLTSFEEITATQDTAPNQTPAG